MSEEISRTALLKEGVQAVAPLAVGAFPFSFIVGALSVSIGMGVAESTLMSLFVFAGSAQIVALNLLSSSASLLIILLTTLVINARHILYSVSLSEYIKTYPLFIRALMAFGLTDEVYACSIHRLTSLGNHPFRHYFYLSAMFGFWGSWVMANLFGALAGSQFPQIQTMGLDFAMVATFIAIVVPQLKSRQSIVAAAIAVLSGLALIALPFQSGLIIASVLGVVAGLTMEKLVNSRKQNVWE